MLTNYNEILKDQGVVLLKNVVDSDLMKKVRKKYDELDKTITRTEIEKEKPIIVLWEHVEGETKRLTNFEEYPELWELIVNSIIPKLRKNLTKRAKRLQLLETIIFNKPAEISNTLNWHQDVAYFPVKPNSQIAVWIPFEIATYERGAMNYAIGSNKLGIRASTNLHTRAKFENDDRELIPSDPKQSGLDVVCMEMTPDDMIVHDGYTWHYSGPNTVKDHTRKGLSVRFITEEAVFDPRAGQGAAFTQQIDIKPGEILKGAAFPLL